MTCSKHLKPNYWALAADACNWKMACVNTLSWNIYCFHWNRDNTWERQTTTTQQQQKLAHFGDVRRRTAICIIVNEYLHCILCRSSEAIRLPRFDHRLRIRVSLCQATAATRWSRIKGDIDSHQPCCVSSQPLHIRNHNEFINRRRMRWTSKARFVDKSQRLKRNISSPFPKCR